MSMEEEIERLRRITDAARLSCGLLWMSQRDDPLVEAAFVALRDALGGREGLRRAIQRATAAGYLPGEPKF